MARFSSQSMIARTTTIRISPRGLRGFERGNEHDGLANGGAKTCSWLARWSCYPCAVNVMRKTMDEARVNRRRE